MGAAALELTAEDLLALAVAIPTSEVVGDRYADMAPLNR